MHSTGVKTLCDRCSRPATLACSRCLRVHYCNAACQATAWKTHHKCICVPTGEPERCAKQDQFGLTPLHYAVLYGKEPTLPPEQLPLLQTVKDSFNGTPADLKSCLAPAVDLDQLISLRKLCADGQVVSLTQREFSQRTGFRYKEEYVATSEILLHLHTHVPKPYLPIYPASMAEINKFNKTRPIVFVAEEPPMGLGLVVGQEIRKGQIICAFGGELVLKSRNNYRAVMNRAQTEAEADRFAGPGCLINDGPPNCYFAAHALL